MRVTIIAYWEHIHSNLVPYKIGRYGQLMEWSADILSKSGGGCVVKYADKTFSF